MAVCGCGLPVCCCQPAVAGGVIYADLRSELSTHLASQALLLRVLCAMPLLQAFPFPSTLGEVKLHQLSQACVFIHSSHGKWVFPHLLWSFPPSTILTSFPTPGCWMRTPAPALSSQAQLVYLQFREGFPSFHLWCAGHPTLFATCLYCFYCLLLSFSFFPQVGGSVCPGGYADVAKDCLWKYQVPLSSPCGPHLPKPSGRRQLAVAQSLLVSPFNMKWRCSAQAGGVEGSKFCLFSVALPARCVSSISPRFHFRGHAFCFSL
jgi:hypothetical protein